ncbi:hypothetical protein [Paenirhodobacter populi]|uniref:Ankyrin repeat domain-containing protein n=1 Tax=Paenirhodobacter populi TaxID=2306993 RepID=A0A443JJ20_9RHOB|nr:hypothetical protein [Sinirhodobacter populi]RWR20520.1 hypothetical protein D2T30_11630 [Sinirhodobacter populi]
MKEVARILLLTISAIAFGGGVVFGLLLMASSSQGGFFPGLGLALGGLAIGAGTFLSWLCNGIVWALGMRSRWFGWAIVAQSLPALLFAGWLGYQIGESFLDRRAGDQRAEIHAAIGADDPAAYDAARARCGVRCQSRAGLSSDLLAAVDAGAIRVARHLVEAGTRMDSDDWYGSRVDLYTCEGSYLPARLGLSAAVARGDRAMVDLLLPVSDDRSREEALLTAARLDRMEMIRAFRTAGVPLPTGDGDPRDGLVAAAASGAAIGVGEWLFAERPVPVGTAELEQAMEALYRFMETVTAPRALPFARLLVAQGADVDAPFRGEPTFLAEAVRTRRAPAARVLIAAGADPARLPAERRAELEALLQEPDTPAYDRSRQGCVAP